MSRLMRRLPGWELLWRAALHWWGHQNRVAESPLWTSTLSSFLLLGRTFLLLWRTVLITGSFGAAKVSFWPLGISLGFSVT